MKTLQTKLSGSSLHEKPIVESSANTSKIALNAIHNSSHLDQERKLASEIQFLIDMPDSEIDYSDIPPIGQRGTVLGPFTPREPHTVTLRLQPEVIAWLESGGKNRSHSINFSLRQAAQDLEREDRERRMESLNPIYDPHSKEFIQAVKLLAGTSQVGREYAQVPEFTDRQLTTLFAGPWVSLDVHTVTLRLDSEVMKWLETAAVERTYRINFALKQASERDMSNRASAGKSLSKAS